MKKTKHIFLLGFGLMLILPSCTGKKEVADREPVREQKIPTDDKKTGSSADNPDIRLFVTAVNEKLAGNYETAAKMFEEYLVKHPTSADAYYNLAGIYDAQSRTLKAIEYSKKACELDKKNKWYLLQKAYLQQRNLDYKETVKTYEQLIKLDPNSPDIYYQMADVYLKLNDIEGSINALNRAEKITGPSMESTYEKYRIYTQAGKYDKAIIELEKIAKENPTETRIFGMLGELYEQVGNKEKAFENYNKILELDPNNGPVHLSLSQYYLSQGKDKESTEELKKAFASPDLDTDTKMRIMLNYFERSERDELVKKEAYELLDIMEKTHPNDAKSYSIYADFLYRDQKIREARDKYKKAVEFEKDKFVIWNQLILLDAQLNDKKALYEDSKQAKELFPTQAGFYFYNGIASNQMKKYDEAIQVLNEGKELVFDNDQLLMEFYQGLGEAYNYTGKHKESDESYEKALALDPNNAYVLNNYSYYLSLRKDKLERAAEMSKKSNEISPNNSSFQDTYGWILFVQGKYDEAAVWLKKSLESGGDKSGTVLEHYGDVMSKLGKKEEAMEFWKKAKETGDYTDKIDIKIKEGKYVE